MGNLHSMGFKIHIGSTTPLEKLKVLYRVLISQMGNCCAEIVCVISPCAFSQMNNLISSHKMLVCETADECLAYNYFRRVYFFFAPIILDMFQDIADRVIARGIVV